MDPVGGPDMDKVNDCVACWAGEDESVTCATNENCPVWLVVPEIMPLPANDTPLGKAPEVMFQL